MVRHRTRLAVGTCLDGYKILKTINCGPIFEIGQAQDPSGEHVIIKCMAAAAQDDLDLCGLLVDEALLLSRLDHFGIRRCVGILREPLCQVLEYIDGGTLAGFLRAARMLGRPFSVARALHIGHEICQALAYLLPRGVVHADISPDNVLVGGNGRVALIDFTFGQWPERRFVKRVAPMRQKLSYNTPEHWFGSEITSATDIYQLGLTLWAVLAGKEPELSERPRRHRPLPPPRPLADIRKDLPRQISELLDDMLHREAEARPPPDNALCRRLWDLACRFDREQEHR